MCSDAWLRAVLLLPGGHDLLRHGRLWRRLSSYIVEFCIGIHYLGIAGAVPCADQARGIAVEDSRQGGCEYTVAQDALVPWVLSIVRECYCE